jgi:hypothetical protein
MTHTARNESITDKIATLIQHGYTHGETAHETAQRITVLFHLNAAEEAARVAFGIAGPKYLHDGTDNPWQKRDLLVPGNERDVDAITHFTKRMQFWLKSATQVQAERKKRKESLSSRRQSRVR